MNKSEPQGRLTGQRDVVALGNVWKSVFEINLNSVAAAARGAEEFALSVGFSPRAALSVAGATEEATLQIVRKAPEGAPPFSVELTRERGAVAMEVRYSEKIPFNPPQTESMIRAGKINDEEQLFDEQIWLQLAKLHVDNVSCVVEGRDRVIRMRLYAREAGKENSLWFLDQAPQLRAGVQIEENLDEHDRPQGLIHDPVAGTVMKLSEKGLFAVKSMNGQKTMRQIYMASIARFGLSSPNDLGNLLKFLGDLEFLETGRKTDARRRLIHRLSNPSISIPKPDSVVTGLYRCVRPLVSPFGVALLLLIGLSGIWPLSSHWHDILALFRQPFHGMHRRTDLVFEVIVMAFAIVLIHELGHGLVCKHFKGRIARLGVEFYLITLIFFCDVTSSWLFRRKWDRILVSLGGPITTFAGLGLALWGYHWSQQSPQWNFVFYSGAVICVLILGMNMNPFLRMDAYYVLMDWTEIPDLRARSFRYLASLLPGFQKAREPKLSAREKGCFLTYGVVGGLVTIVFFAAILSHYMEQLADHRNSDAKLYLILVSVAIILFNLFVTVSKTARRMRYREYPL